MNASKLKVRQKVNLNIKSNGVIKDTKILVNGQKLSGITGITVEGDSSKDTMLRVSMRAIRPSLELRGQFDIVDIILVSSAIDNYRGRGA